MRSSFIRMLLIAGAVWFVPLAARGQALPTKVGFVNSAQIEAQLPAVAAAQVQLNKEFAPYQQELQRMQDSMTVLGGVFARLDSATRERRRKEFEATDSTFSDRAAALQKKMQDRQIEVFRPLMEKVNSAIEAIRSEDGFAIIFSVGTQTSGILAADKRLDITEKVLARLKAASATTTGGPVITPAGVTRPKK